MKQEIVKGTLIGVLNVADANDLYYAALLNRFGVVETKEVELLAPVVEGMRISIGINADAVTKTFSENVTAGVRWLLKHSLWHIISGHILIRGKQILVKKTEHNPEMGLDLANALVYGVYILAADAMINEQCQNELKQLNVKLIPAEEYLDLLFMSPDPDKIVADTKLVPFGTSLPATTVEQLAVLLLQKILKQNQNSQADNQKQNQQSNQNNGSGGSSNNQNNRQNNQGAQNQSDDDSSQAQQNNQNSRDGNSQQNQKGQSNGTDQGNEGNQSNQGQGNGQSKTNQIDKVTDALNKRAKDVQLPLSPAIAEKLLDDIIEAIDTIEKMVGSDKIAANIIAKAKQGNIDWRRVLEHELGQTKLSEPRINKTRPDKRTGNVPSLKRRSTPEIVAYVDTSGSVSDALLRDFVNELGGIARQLRVEITVVPYSVGAAMPQKLKPNGELHITDRGGTSLEKALNDTLDIARRAETIVILTDGYDDFPKTLSQLKAKKIFVKPGDDKDVSQDFFKQAARFGKVITMNKPSGWF